MPYSGGERFPSFDLEDYGEFGGCDYCIDELGYAIKYSIAAGREVPQVWLDALKKAKRIRDIEEQRAIALENAR